MTQMSETGIYLVTGASGGIGLSCAHALSSRGVNLLITDLDKERLESTAVSLKLSGGCVETLASDISDQSNLEEIQSILKERGGLAGCIHAAGVSGTMATAAQILRVNLGGTIRLLDTLFPVTNKGSAIICIASQAGHFWAPGVSPQVRKTLLESALADDICEQLAPALGVDEIDSNNAYGLSKYGVIQLVVKRASQFGQRGARLLSLSPGIIDTPMAATELSANTESMQSIIDLTPVDARIGKPEEIASVACFLCSSDASFVSGIDILVDGGSTFQVLGSM